MRTPLIAGNWKMNGSFEDTNILLASIEDGLELRAEDAEKSKRKIDVLVCPPLVYLETAARAIDDSDIALGAQNLNAESHGAFTGEISAHMLKDLTCSYVIVGHSERRQLFGETDTMVGKKFKAAAQAGLKPILCVGETLEEREEGKAIDVIKRQIDAVMDIACEKCFDNAVIAYEPVWAIGTGKTASPQQAQDIHAEIRQMIAARSGKIADKLRILYGGSVKPANAAEIFAMQDIDGGLIGGASLKAEDFLAIINAA